MPGRCSTARPPAVSVAALAAFCLIAGPLPASATTITNVATVTYEIGATSESVDSNLVTIPVLPSPTPATVTFWQYAPGAPSSTPTPADGGLCQTSPSVFVPLPLPTDLSGSVINTASVPILQTGVYHAGEAIFLTLADGNRNLDPAVRDVVEVRVTTSTGDEELLRLQETGPDTALFATAIQSAAIPPAPTAFDCRLSVDSESRIFADYTDSFYPTDQAAADVLVDPLGIVFNSSTGAPVDGATVTLIDMSTGLPATVFGDDGLSTFPATVVSGTSAVDSSARLYLFPPGGFRFPFVAPGDYRLVVTPPGGYTAPSVVPLPVLLTVLDPGGDPYAVGIGSFGDLFTVVPGPALNIDIPVDPITTALRLEKSVSKTEVSAGDFLQYRLILDNLSTVVAATGVMVTDVLPLGMRYKGGSLRLNGAPSPDPSISADGRTLTISVGAIAAGGRVEISYVAQVGADAPAGNAVNRAIAAGAGGASSNAAQAVVRIREPFFSERFTIIGRVVEGECDTAWERLSGVPNVRMLLDDGTYVVTDPDGQFHFTGVRPGAHVVQLDLDSLPPHLEVVPCIQNSRFAGRAFSQFVEAQGGTLWRADFYVKRTTPLPSTPMDGVIGLRLQSELLPASDADTDVRVQFRATVDGGAAPVTQARVSIALPDGITVLPGSAHVDGLPVGDPAVAEQVVTFALGNVGSDWSRLIEFTGVISRGSAPTLPVEPALYTFRGHFNTLEATLTAAGAAELDALVSTLRDTHIERIEVIGHTDNVRIAPRSRHRFADNDDLSKARAGTIVDRLTLAFGLSPDRISAEGRGADLPVAENQTEEGRAANRRVEVRVYSRSQSAETSGGLICPQGGYRTRALVLFDTVERRNISTTAVDSRLPCPTTGRPAAPGGMDLDGTGGQGAGVAPSAPVENGPPVVDPEMDDGLRRADSGRQVTTVAAPTMAASPMAPAPKDALRVQDPAPDDVTAAGGNTDWLADQAPGIEWLFPAPDHNPRAPAVRIVIKHRPGQTLTLTSSGRVVDPLTFDGTTVDPGSPVAVSIWRGLPLVEGENLFVAAIHEANGDEAATLSRAVHYANRPVRAEYAAGQSMLIADGINAPVIAVRLLDEYGRPVRAGVTGSYTINPPYVPSESVTAQQRRQLAGLDRFTPHYVIEGDDGMAYLELSPTTETGMAVLDFIFHDGQRRRAQELRVWLEPAPRDWVVVGFASGTVGYNILKGNMQSLDAQGTEEGVYTDGQVSLYAKGRVLGQWLLTLAYDSDKEKESFGRRGLFSTIDPNEFYTLYGDTTEQRHDAASQEKLYLKLEREQFYALFGDYDTGLTQTQLSRYSRSLTGVKTEYHDGTLDVTAYGAETEQNFARDEIQGNGTSGLYRLSNGDIVINSEKVRIETRDRFRSEIIIASRSLLRHIDYDIDYSAGTLYFREPITSRDFNFNPIFIVVEYETSGVADTDLNAGGRVGVRLFDGALTLGATYIHDDSTTSRTDLGGADIRWKLGPETELRVEGALSDGQNATVNLDGTAYLVELEHHDRRFDVLVYTRRQEAGFGVNQQNASEGGMAKSGLDGRVRLTDRLAVQTQYYHLDNLSSEAVRDAASAQLDYRTDRGGVRGGLQFALDEAAGGQEFESWQALVGANRYFFDKKLELHAHSEISLGGWNESVDYPSRYVIGASYALTTDVRLIVDQEVTDGDAFDSSTTRIGLQAVPWQGARLTSTLNQSHMAEYGPRTFGQLGLTQAFLVGERWGFDLSADSSQTFNESGSPPLVINPNYPIASGGMLAEGSLTDNFYALSGGATYRSDLWSWNGRTEARIGQRSDRYGYRTAFLRQAQAGVAFAFSAQLFRTVQEPGTVGLLAGATLSWAYRPLGRQWSVLDRLEFKHDEVENGTGIAGGGLFGDNGLVAVGDARSSRLVNNFTLNRVSRAWTEADRRGNLFQLQQRYQWSLYYGAKYVLDRIDGEDYHGFTDLIGLEWRADVTWHVDVGLRGGMLHVWDAHQVAYSWGPMIGAAPIENVWITVGYNFTGFHDGDFSEAGYTAQGVYVTFRIKFDQQSRLTLARPYATAVSTADIASSTSEAKP